MLMEKENNMDYEFQMEKKMLLRKLMYFFGGAIIGVIITLKVNSEASFTSIFLAAFVFGVLFYIPGRLRDIFSLTIYGVVFYTIIYILVFMLLGAFIGDFASLLIVIIPFVDMGYSIYKVISLRNSD